MRKCSAEDFEAANEVINDAAQAYKGVIPSDRWQEPYMSGDYLRHDIEAGVQFWDMKRTTNSRALWAFRTFMT